MHIVVWEGNLCPYVYVHAQLLSRVWLCDPMNCSPPGSSVHGILQARVLEWVALPPSRGSSQPRGMEPASAVSPALAGRFFTTEPPGILVSLCKYKKSSCGRKCQNTAVRVAWCPCKRHVQVLIRGDSTSSCLETGSLQIKLSWGSWDEIVVDWGLTLNPTPMSLYKRERAVWDPEWEMVEKAMWDRSRDGSEALGSWGALWIPASHQHRGDRIA